MADNIETNPDEAPAVSETYKNMMGTENPPEVTDLEAGKVELSVPRKVEPDPDVEEEPEPEPEPEPDAVPIYHAPYVDEEGIEHFTPPTYDRSGMKEEKIPFKRPADSITEAAAEMKEDILDDDTPADINDFLSEVDDEPIIPTLEEEKKIEPNKLDEEPQHDDEVPDFVRSWKSQQEANSVDDEVNAALDGQDDDTAEGEDDGFMLDADFGDETEEDEDDVTAGQKLEPEDIIVDEGKKPASGGFIPRFELSPEEQAAAEKEDAPKDENQVELTETLSDGDVLKQQEVLVDADADSDFGADDSQTQELPTVDVEVPPTPQQTENMIMDEIVTEEPSEATKMRDNADLFAREYSGYLGDQYFVVDSQSLQGEFVGNNECNAIQINASQSSYGWGVHFDNGWFMGIRDVREYQLRHGCLPADSGEIMFGAKKMAFKKVSRIVLYEVPRYFTYLAK